MTGAHLLLLFPLCGAALALATRRWNLISSLLAAAISAALAAAVVSWPANALVTLGGMSIDMGGSLSVLSHDFALTPAVRPIVAFI